MDILLSTWNWVDKVTGTEVSLKSSTFNAGPVVPIKRPGFILLLSAFRLTDQLSLAGLVLRPTLSDFFCYIAVQTIASSFDAFSLSRSRCFRFRPVAHFWASKSIREGFTSAFLLFYGRLLCCQSWLPNYTVKLRRELHHSELVVIVAVNFRSEGQLVFQDHQRFVGDLANGQ